MLSPVAATLPRLRWIASLGTSPLKRSTHSPFTDGGGPLWRYGSVSGSVLLG